MRRFIVLAIAVSAALGYSGPAAGMSGPSEVVVVNEPLAVDVVDLPLPVEITNPAPASPPARFQLVGFTTTGFEDFDTIAGIPSMFEMIAACQAEVDPASRMCRVDDIQLTTVIPTGLPTVDGFGNRIRAWLNPDPENIIEPITALGNDCLGWSRTSALGMTVDASGQLVRGLCSDPHPVACCALVP